MDRIVKATPLENYQIEIITSSGLSGIFDVKPYLGWEAMRSENLRMKHISAWFALHIMELYGRMNKILARTLLFGISKMLNESHQPMPKNSSAELYLKLQL